MFLKVQPFQEYEFTVTIMPYLLAEAYVGYRHILIPYFLKVHSQIFFHGVSFYAETQPVGQGNVEAVFIKNVGVAPLVKQRSLTRTEIVLMSTRDFLFGRDSPEGIEEGDGIC